MFIKIYLNIKKFKKILFCFSKVNNNNDVNSNSKESGKIFEEKNLPINKEVLSTITLFNKKNKIKDINSKKFDSNKKNSFKNFFFKNSKKNIVGLVNVKKLNNNMVKELSSNSKEVEESDYNNNLNRNKVDKVYGVKKNSIDKDSINKQLKLLIKSEYSDDLNKSIKAFIIKKRKKEKIVITVVNFLKKYKRIVIDHETFYSTILSIYKNNFFLLKFLKLKIYTLFYKNILRLAKNKKKYLILQLKKKKSKYSIILIINNKIEMMITLGVLLSYAGQKKKSLKRSIKGFEIFLNAAETIYLNFKKGAFVRSIVLDFLDKKIFISKKKIIKLFASSNFFFFSFYTNFGKNFYKKYRSIKKNFLKKNIVFFNKEIRKFYLKTSKKTARFK